MLATTGTLRVVLRRIHIDQSPQETPERAWVPKPPPLGAHGEVHCAGVQRGFTCRCAVRALGGLRRGLGREGARQRALVLHPKV